MSRGHGRIEKATLRILKRYRGPAAILGPRVFGPRPTRSQMVSLRRALKSLAGEEPPLVALDARGHWSLAPRPKKIVLSGDTSYRLKYKSTGYPTWRDEDPAQLELDIEMPHDARVAEVMRLLYLIGPTCGRGYRPWDKKPFNIEKPLAMPRTRFAFVQRDC